MNQRFESLKKQIRQETESGSKILFQNLRNLLEISDEKELNLDYISEVLETPKLDLNRAIAKCKPAGIRLKGGSLMIDDKSQFIVELDKMFADWNEQEQSSSKKK